VKDLETMKKNYAIIDSEITSLLKGDITIADAGKNIAEGTLNEDGQTVTPLQYQNLYAHTIETSTKEISKINMEEKGATTRFKDKLKELNILISIISETE
jgi:hypothetical protein